MAILNKDGSKIVKDAGDILTLFGAKAKIELEITPAEEALAAGHAERIGTALQHIGRARDVLQVLSMWGNWSGIEASGSATLIARRIPTVSGLSISGSKRTCRNCGSCRRSCGRRCRSGWLFTMYPEPSSAGAT